VGAILLDSARCYGVRVTIPDLLRRARQSAGLSQRELARSAGTSGPTVAAYESGTKDPRACTLARLLESTGHTLVFAPRQDASNLFHDLMCERWAQLVLEDPSLVARAESVLDGMAGDHTDAWRHLLRAGPDAVIAVLTSPHPAASALKSDAPFGRMKLITEHDRQVLLRAAYAA
jgi:transcriptional regulator with XRE-family HTH domain